MGDARLCGCEVQSCEIFLKRSACRYVCSISAGSWRGVSSAPSTSIDGFPDGGWKRFLRLCLDVGAGFRRSSLRGLYVRNCFGMYLKCAYAVVLPLPSCSGDGCTSTFFFRREVRYAELDADRWWGQRWGLDEILGLDPWFHCCWGFIFI